MSVQAILGAVLALSVPCASLGQGVFSYWKFNENTGSATADALNAASSATVDTGQWRANGIAGSSLNFDGLLDRVDLPAIDVPANQFTIAVWIRPESFSTDEARLVSKATGTSESNHLWMLSTVEQGGFYYLRARVKTDGTTQTLIADGEPLSADTWTHAAMVYDGSILSVYKDGVIVGSLPLTGSVAQDPSIAVGVGNQPTGAGDRPFHGLIDELKFYDGALATTAIQDLANPCSGQPESIISLQRSALSTGELIDFSGTDSTDCDGSLVSFDWDFGDGSSAQGVTVGHAYSSAGQYSATLTVTDDTGNVASASVDVEVFDPSQRVSDRAVASYRFEEGQGATVNDTSFAANHLTISDATATQWLSCGGLRLNAPTVISNGSSASALIAAVKASNELTVEGWVVPANVMQTGPARIAGVSGGTSARNFTLAQDGDSYNVRLRTTGTGDNGLNPSTSSPPGAVAAGPTHVAYTRNASGEARLYIDGVLVSTENVPSSTSNWEESFGFLIGNEVGEQRPWLGDLYLVEVQDRALTALEVAHNYQAGYIGSCNRPPEAQATADVDHGVAPLSVQFDASGSTDPDGDPLSYSWQLTDSATATGIATSFVFTEPGEYPVLLTATDAGGESDSQTVWIRVFDPNQEPRVSDDLLAYYAFDQTEGGLILDRSNDPVRLDLAIDNPANSQWRACGGLELQSPSLISSLIPADGVAAAVRSGGELTLEAWITPADNQQDGPARILSLSADTQNRNATLGQDGDAYTVRFRTSETGPNGLAPSLSSNPGTLVAGQPNHVLYTRDSSGLASVYVNGVLSGTETVTGDTSNWSDGYPLLLGNEATGNRPWLGTYHIAAIYDRALSSQEAQQNFLAGFSSPCPAPPSAVIEATPVVGNAPLSVSFNGSASSDFGGYLVSYAWDFGDGTQGTGAQVSHLYDMAGNYTVTLTVTDNEGLANTAYRTIRVVTPGANFRVADGLIAEYDFLEGQGTSVLDISGVGLPLDLTIEDPGYVEWLTCGGLGVRQETLIRSAGPASKLTDRILSTGALTLEAWVRPDNLTQGPSSPARIATLSESASRRNVTLGQKASGYEARLRTTETSLNGTNPSTGTATNVAMETLTHVVYTRDASGNSTIYVDGSENVTGLVGGDFSNWDPHYAFAVANELDRERGFLGDLHLVAVYERALSTVEVNQNFQAGFVDLCANTNAPTAVDQSVVTDEDQNVPVVLSANDPDGDSLTYTVLAAPTRGALAGTPPALTYIPEQNFNGTDSLTFVASDGSNTSNVATVTLTVNPVNDPPMANSDAVSLNEDATANITLVASDLDGDALSYEILSQPGSGTLTGSGPIFVYTPAANFFGTDSFSYLVSDGTANSSAETVSLSVISVNDIPIAIGASAVVDEDSSVVVSVSASDVESPSLNYVVSTPPSHGVVSGNGPDFSYTPNPGFSGSDSFSFVANDGLSDSVPALVSIVVNAVNDPPVAVDIAQTLNEDEPVSVVLSASDEDGDALTFALTSQPQHGELTGTSPNLTYTPDPDFNGVDSFTYQAFDGTVSSMGATVTLTVTAVNDLPLAQDDLINLAEDTTAMVRLTASDADGDLLTFAIVDAPANGTLVGGGSDYDYTPGAGFSGTDSLTFVANDGAADSNLATITLVVEPINDPPTADDLSISTNEDVAVALTLAGTDPDGDAITLAITQAPLRGTLSGTPPNLTYLPNADENGEDTFRFTVSDGIAESDPATVTVQILAQNDAPVADPQSLVVTEASLALTLTGSDVDGDPLTYQVVVSPAGGTLSGTAPNLTYTRNSGFSGPDSFTFQVSDGQADSAAAVVNLDVQVNNAAPEITSTPVLDAAEGAAYAYDVDASDADGDSLTYSLVIAPQGMSIDSATGLISWVPLSDTLGAVDVRVRASDPQGAFAEQDYVVTVPGSTINRSYLGTDFWLTFLRNDIDPGAPAVPALSIAAPGGASGTISVASLAIDIPFTIPAGGLERIELPISVVTRTNGTPDPVGVNVSADAPITVMAFNERTASTDAAQVYPTNVLASDYTIPAFHSLQLGAFGIVATEDNTLVTVTPGPGVTQMIGNGTFNQAPFNITLQQGDVWTNTPGSRARFVTGTTLRSSRPIGVFAGAICANVPNEETISCDHMIEQVPGDDQLATRFLSVPFATRFNGDLFRFVATTDDTVVRVNGVESAYLDALEFVDRVIDGVAEITSTAPIHAAQIATGQAFDAVERGATEPGNSDADPFMVLLPPTTAYLDEYIFTTAGTDRLNSHYVNVIIPDTAAASLVLDGQPADISTLVPIEDTGYLGGAIEVSYGTHTMSAAEKFGVTIYGWGPAESYGTNGNAILGDLPPVNRLEVTPLNQTQTVGANACFTITTKNGLDYAVPFARIDVRVSGARTIRQSIATNDTGTANYCYIGIDAGTETATFISGPAIESANVTWEALSADTQAAPIIISLPPLELNEATHAYTIDAFDPNGDAITYGLVAGPAGVTVDGASGTLSWTPTVPQDRVSTLHAISVSATDPFGNQGVQNYELLVNYAPVFSEITPEESESFAPTFTVRAIGGNVDTNQLAIIEAPPRATVTNSGPDNQWLLQSGLNNTVGGEINLVREALEVFNPYCRAPLTDRSALNVKSVWTSTEDLKLVQVAPLTDTDGNGVINTADDQAIIGIGPDLTALDATTGTFLWRVSGAATIDVGAAIADIDGDNVPEVLVANDAATGERHLYGYSNLGDLLWESVTPVLPGNFDETRTAIEVFDLDGDGAVEIVVGPSVLDGTGNLLWQFNTAVSSPVVEALPWIADLEGDGQYEVLFGSEIRNADGSLRWSINGAVGGTNPIAQFVASDLDQDGFTDIIASVFDGLSHSLWVFEAGGSVKWGPVPMEDASLPVVADFDHDGRLEIYAPNDGLRLSETGEALAQEEDALGINTDFLRVVVGDFNGDGLYEVIRLRNGTTIEIVDVLSGLEWYSELGFFDLDARYGGLALADIDRDGSVEILAGADSNSSTIFTKAMEPRGPGWVSGPVSTPSFGLVTTSNEVNVAIPARDVDSLLPDLWIGKLRAGSVGAGYELSAKLTNRGPADVASAVTVEFYRGDPDSPGSVLLGAQVVSGLRSTQSVTVMLGGLTRQQVSGDIAVQLITSEIECETRNNRVVTPVYELEVFDGPNRGDRRLFLPGLLEDQRLADIASESPTVVAVDSTYVYDIDLVDPNVGDGLRVNVTGNNLPSDMSWNQETGQIRWTPTIDDLGSYIFFIQARDLTGLVTTERVDLTVVETNNAAPTITSQPEIVAAFDTPYSYDVEATDPDGDPLTFSLGTAPAGMTIDANSGVISWTPTAADEGQPMVSVLVNDGLGGQAVQDFAITVGATINSPPVITQLPSDQARVSVVYNDQIVATDADGDPLTFTKVSGLNVVSINPSTGAVFYSPSNSTVGFHTIEFTVSDGTYTVPGSWNITVAPSNQTLQVAVELADTAVQPNTMVEVGVVATGAAGPYTLSLTMDGASIPLDPSGRAMVDSGAPGLRSFVGTAVDQRDTVTDQRDLIVIDPSDVTPPLVALTAPVEGDVITAPTPMVGDVLDDNLAIWRVFLQQGGTRPFVQEIASGSTEGSGISLGDFDPTLLMNGAYSLVLEATDFGGNTATDSIAIEVDGNMKVGHFSITLEDVSIDMVGIPLQVTRTYDTRQRNENLDFGFGWSVDYQNLRLTESRAPGQFWFIEEQGGSFGQTCAKSNGDNYVNIRLPDGETHRFRAVADPECKSNLEFITDPFFFLGFEPLGDTTSELEQASFGPLRVLSGDLVDLGAPDEPVDPKFYRLTTQEGFIYELDESFGIRQVIDNNGNTLTYTDSGIFHSAGKQIDFVRDIEGRISEMVLPNGTSLHYEYDGNGDLVSMTDQINSVAEYTYLPGHYLENLDDLRGTRVSTNEYDVDGRLVAVIDATNRRIELTHDIAARTESVRDRLGNTTVYQYDERGNVLFETNALNETIGRTYDEFDNQLTETDPLGNTTTWTYDNRGNQLTETNAEGETTTYTYDTRGQVLTQTDDLGNVVVTNVYDLNGNIGRTTDALGNETNFVIGNGGRSLGLLFSITDAEGGITSYTYDNSGNRLSETDQDGNVMEWSYDQNNNVLSETRRRVNNNGQVEISVTSYEYDDKDRRIFTTDSFGNFTETVYDDNGRVTAEWDENRNFAGYTFDSKGNMVAQRFANPADSISWTYDNENRLIREFDRNNNRTDMTYDEAGRLLETIYDDETSGLADNPRTTNEYDAAGRLTASIDERGNRTEYEYDGEGRRTLVRNALNQVTTFEYDDRGLRVAMTDANSRTTRYVYDAAGRLVETIFPDDTPGDDTDNDRMLMAYDGLGRKISETDELGRVTQFEYDGRGNLTAVIDALNQRTEYGYDGMGNKISQTDALGRVTRWEYDRLGRVVSRALPLGQAEYFTYDDVGNRIARVDFNGAVTNWTYNNDNRVETETFEDFSTRSWTYRFDGSVDTVTDSRGVTDYDYDERDRLTRITYPDGAVVEYQYDEASNRVALITANQSVVYTYDVLNRLDTVTDDTGSTGYTYDSVGLRSGMTYPNGTQTVYSYDERNRLTGIDHIGPGASNLLGLTYVLNANGTRAQILEDSGRQVTYTYDDLNRLTQEAVIDPNLTDRTTSWVYDAVGNRLSQDDAGVVTTYVYNDNDQLLTETTGADANTYIYDANGNTRQKRVNGVTEVSYQWDFEDRMIGATNTSNISYAYDENGIRQSQTVDGVTTRFLVDPNRDYAQVIEERDGAGGLGVVYTHGDDLISQQRLIDGQTGFYHYDGLGSTRLLTDSNGMASNAYLYTGFGEIEQQLGTGLNIYLYTGEQFDAVTEFYYLRARYMDPDGARFVSQDKFSGFSHRPHSLNKYLYADANPTMYTDPTGLFTLGSVGAGLSTITSTVRLGVGVVSAVNRVSSGIMLAHSTTTAVQLLVQGLKPEGIEAVRKSYTAGAASNDRFKKAISADGAIDAAFTFAKNALRIARGIRDNKKNQVGTVIRRRSSTIVFYMPTPEPNTIRGPGILIPTPLSISVPRSGSRKVELQFGGFGSGRYFGIGCRLCTSGGSKKPKQWARMDWHDPHKTGVGNNDFDYWIDSARFWHFHIPKDR